MKLPIHVTALCAAFLFSAAATATQPPDDDGAEENEVVLELDGVVVEGADEFQDLQLHESKAMTEFIEKLQLRDATQRTAELQKLHQSGITSILDLTRYSPIPLGGSDPRTDTFFLQNYMRPDLNPRDADPLSLRR